MSTMESIMMEADEEEAFLKELQEKGMTLEEYEKQQKQEELYEEMQQRKIEILKQSKEIKQKMQNLYDELTSYNNMLDEIKVDNIDFISELNSELLEIDQYSHFSAMERDGIAANK